MLKDKDETILNYQTLLKKDRDEHSLAAARMQDELRRLQHALTEQQKINMKYNIPHYIISSLKVQF